MQQQSEQGPARFWAPQLPAIAAAIAVLLAGCSTKQQGAQASAAPPPAAPALPAPKVVTEQDTKDNKTLRLKFGQPVTYQRDGVSITVAPRSWEKMPESPEELSGNMLDCGQWQKVVETWVVDVQPNAAWRGWRRDFQGLFGLFSENKDPEYGYYKDVAVAAFPEKGQSLDKSLAEASRGWNRETPLHFEQTGPQFLAACRVNAGPGSVDNGAQFIPNDKPLIGLELKLPTAEGQNPRAWPALAIWTP